MSLNVLCSMDAATQLRQLMYQMQQSHSVQDLMRVRHEIDLTIYCIQQKVTRSELSDMLER